MDAALRKQHRPSTDEQLAGLPLALQVTPPDIRTPVQSAPGSESSRAAAEAVKSSTRSKQHEGILACLARVPAPGVLSRYELHLRTGISITTLCARLDDLTPMHVEKVEGACRSHEKPSLRVCGYRLTDAGRARVVDVQP